MLAAAAEEAGQSSLLYETEEHAVPALRSDIEVIGPISDRCHDKTTDHALHNAPSLDSA